MPGEGVKVAKKGSGMMPEAGSQASNARGKNARPDAMPEQLLFVMKRDGTVTYSSAGGPRTSASLGKGTREALSDNVHEQFIKYAEKAIGTGKAQHFDYKGDLTDGTHLFKATCAALSADDALIVAEDFTDAGKWAQASWLTASIIESSEDAIISAALDGTVTSWNAGAEKLYGYSSAELIGQNIALVALKENVGNIAAMMARLRGGEKIPNFETRHVKKNGREFDVSVRISPILDGEGNVTGVSIISRDITERMRAEQALRESEEKFQALTDSSPAAIIAYQGENIVFANRAALEMSGYSEREVVGKKFMDFVHPGDQELVKRHVTARVKGEPAPTRYEMRLLLKNGAWR